MVFRIALGRFPAYRACRPLAHIPQLSQHRCAPVIRCFSWQDRRDKARRDYKSSGPYTKSAIVPDYIGYLLVLGALGVYIFKPSQPSESSLTEKPVDYQNSQEFVLSEQTESYLTMAPNTPPGRPGTLTPEQEIKLRELWAATMKVFGVYEPAPELNGAATPSIAASDTTEDAGSGKKDKKKSRLNVFRRHKTEKGGDGDSASASGTSTPADVSQLSIADEDDKHGQNKDFKTALANSAPEDLRKAFWSMVKHDHPDGLLLRFLRARKWDVDKALIMLISTMHWRSEEMHVDDDIMRRGELGALEDSKSDDPKVKKEGEDFLAQMRMGKSFLHGVDKEGRPLCVVRARLHRQGEQTEQSLERFTIYTIENARMLLRPPIDTATVVFDMTNFSMANMDYTPVKFMIKCFEANYPESLGAVLLYKAPWIFQGIWSIIRGWLDPVVAGKIHFAKNVDELENYIPRSQIPTELGGDEKWEYNYVEPNSSENDLLNDHAARDGLLAKQSELVRKYESTILNWIHSGEQKEDVEKSIEQRRQERNAIAEDMRKNYWDLDPYIRARTLYDRTGVLGAAGKLNFYPEKANESTGSAAAPVDSAAKPTTSQDDLD